jgi:Apea-like HEPN
LCYKSIQQAVKDEITKSFNSKVKGDFENSMNSISDNLNSKIDKHLFYFPLMGFILVDIEEISIGDVTLKAFNEKIQLDILERCNINDNSDPFTHKVRSCISENFIEKSTVIIPAYGDRDKAEQIAREKANIVINYFRFITCLLTHGRINENLVKISIESAWPTKNDPFFYELPDKKEICLANDRGRRPFENFIIDKGRLDDLTNNGYFIDVSEFVFKEEKTELETSILTAIYWIGEAQNDYDKSSAFLKYWTALESIFTESKERRSSCEQYSPITKTLCKSVSILLACSDYEFIQSEEIKKTYKELEKLYDARSKIVHNGSYGEITSKQLSNICNHASRTVLILFSLRKDHHISSLSKIKPTIDKLYDEIN